MKPVKLENPDIVLRGPADMPVALGVMDISGNPVGD